MAEHLRPGTVYLVQLDLHDRSDSVEVGRSSTWEVTRGDTTLRVSWTTEEVDLERGELRQRSRLEILTGEHGGDVVEETHEMTAWTPETWAAVIDASTLAETATHDGEVEARPRVALAKAGRLLWHELGRV